MKNRLYRISIILFIASIALGCEEEEENLLRPTLSMGSTSMVSAVGFKTHWKPFPLVDYYLLDVALDPDFQRQLDPSFPLSIKDTFQLIENAQPQTLYYIRVAAYTTAGTFIEYSPTSTVDTKSLPFPKAYAPLELGTHQIHAAWSAVAEAEGYELQLAEDIDFEKVINVYQKNSRTDTTQLIDNLKRNQAYFYRVRSVKKNATSAYSNIVYTNTTDLSQPNLNSPATVAHTSVELNWDAVNMASSYRLEVSNDPLFLDEQASVYDVEITGQSITLPNLQPNTLYYARLRAKQGSFYSMFSEVIQFQTLAVNRPVLAAPSDVDVNTFTVHWNTVALAESYEVELSEDQDFRSLLPAYNRLMISGTSLPLIELAPDTEYYLRIRAYGMSSYSQYSDTLQVRTLPLEAPVNVLITDRKIDQFSLDWPEVNGAKSYLLEVSTDSNFEQVLTNYQSKEIIESEIQLSELDKYNTYYVRLRSKHENILSPLSTVIVIDAAIPSDCALAERLWEDNWIERYQYSQGLLTLIEGDSASTSSSKYRWDLFWDAGQLEKAERYDADNQGNLHLSEVWEYGYSSGRWVSLHRKDAGAATLELIQLIYDAEGKLHGISSYADGAASQLNYQEYYIYADGRIVEAQNELGNSIRKWKYSDYYDPESFFSPEAHILLKDPTASKIIGYQPHNALGIYEHFSDGNWRRQTFVYGTNSLGVPQKMYSEEPTSTITFSFQSCGF